MSRRHRRRVPRTHPSRSRALSRVPDTVGGARCISRRLSRRYGADPSLTLPGDEKAPPTGLLAMLGCSGGDACGAGAADATDGAGAAKSDDAGGAAASDGRRRAAVGALQQRLAAWLIPN